MSTYVDDDDRKILGAFHVSVASGGSEKAVSKIPLADETVARKVYKDGAYYLTDHHHDRASGLRKIVMTPVDIYPPTSSSCPTTYRSDGFYVIQWEESAEVA